MQIIPIHYKISKPVENYKEIKSEAEALMRFVERGQFKGYYNKAFAVAHCQVSETPYAFFVVAQECINEKMFEYRVIINPEILAAPLYKKVGVGAGKSLPIKDEDISIPNAIEYQEPCLSFPYRKPKRLNRYDKIKVKYQIPSLFGLKTIKRELTGIASQIYQHEYDHTQGKNIWFESETPVKWWELFGKPRSKGGVSIDNFTPNDMTSAKETATDNNKLKEYGKKTT